ncbi:4-coumarate--CoA ligase-like 4 [Hibiscus syriacus]|uniref:4-coumarate--CoA ligase-like 4 n=1 Tax=Hibiscus syriacus TaxID=106335 RepID=A0A6A3BDQ8_HIBSY|nr:4-coumarate--CoA ligase-like 4 [Hibiscus syriacus]
MSGKESRAVPIKEESGNSRPPINRSGFDSSSGIYSSVHQLPDHLKVPSDPNLDIVSFVLSQFPRPHVAESKLAFIDSATNQHLTYAQLHRSVRSLAGGLYHLGVCKGDVVFLLSPNSLLYPTMCLAIFSIGAILSPANPINTPSEIAKQVLDSGAKLVISTPEELHKFERIRRFDFQEMVKTIRVHKINNVAAVPPVVLGLVKHCKGDSSLATLRRIGSGAAPLSKELTEAFRAQFPWVEMRQGYGLTESCGTATGFVFDDEAKAHPGSCGALLPTFSAKVVDIETGSALPPYKEGELWLKGPSIMKGYLRNEEATNATLDKDGWLKTGDLGYFDEEGFVYIVDRIKELIKHNGYQVAPAELEALLLTHPHVLDAAVIPVEHEESGQIPMAYVVKAAASQLTEEQVIQFVAAQVAPYKKVRRVEFVDAIPKSAAGKILRKQLILQSQCSIRSQL